MFSQVCFCSWRGGEGDISCTRSLPGGGWVSRGWVLPPLRVAMSIAVGTRPPLPDTWDTANKRVVRILL